MKKIALPIAMLALSFAANAGNEKPRKKFVVKENMNAKVKPADNFYMFVNGNWYNKSTIPAAESGIGAFLDLHNKSIANLKQLFAKLQKTKHKQGSIEQQVSDFYASGINTSQIEANGYNPIKPYLQQIDAINDVQGVMQFVAEQQTILCSNLFQMQIGADEKNSSMNIAAFYQGGLGLPDRDYYFKDDAATADVIKAYKKFLVTAFSLTGTDQATAINNSDAIYNLEKQIATAHRTNVDLRDPQSNYNKMTVASLNSTMPNINWNSLLANLHIKTEVVNVGQPAHFSNINTLLATVPVSTWKLYLKAQLFANFSNLLSSNFENAAFNYFGKALEGRTEMKPRSERIIEATDNNLKHPLGQLYVKNYFSEDAKKRMLTLINNLQKAFENRINNLDWMSDVTKIEAKNKLHTFLKKIGYPDKWDDYSPATISPNNYCQNNVECSKLLYNMRVAKVDKPVDRTEWGMTPSTVNAYYNPTFNEIVFPAGILQFPFFDPDADDAINYGGIGMVIGHEMTHGFDDQGAQYDKEGNLKNWWTADDEAKFKAKGKAVVDLYSKFTMLDTLHVKGELTLGENIADIGGLAIAYEAFKMTEQGQSNTKIDGYTPDQRFFISYAQIWKNKRKDESVRQRINTDPHSPPLYRVLAPLMQFTPFYKAFDIKEGDKMFVAEKDRIKIW